MSREIKVTAAVGAMTGIALGVWVGLSRSSEEQPAVSASTSATVVYLTAEQGAQYPGPFTDQKYIDAGFAVFTTFDELKQFVDNQVEGVSGIVIHGSQIDNVDGMWLLARAGEGSAVGGMNASIRTIADLLGISNEPSIEPIPGITPEPGDFIGDMPDLDPANGDYFSGLGFETDVSISTPAEFGAANLNCFSSWQDPIYFHRPRSVIERIRDTGCNGTLVFPTATIYPFVIPTPTRASGNSL